MNRLCGRLADALEREHRRAEFYQLELYTSDDLARGRLERANKARAERDAAVQRAERAEAEVEGMLSDSTRWMGRAIPAEAEVKRLNVVMGRGHVETLKDRDEAYVEIHRYRAAIREALAFVRNVDTDTYEALQGFMADGVHRILSAALDTEKGDAS